MRSLRLPTTFLALAVMGAAIEIIKAPPGWFTDERYAFGNVSTFWLLFSFIPALCTTSLVRGALTGLAGVMSALLGFYIAMAFMFPDAWGSGGIRAGVIACLRSGSMWMMLGVLSGPAMGVLAAWINQRQKRTWAWAIAAVLFIAEPLVCLAISHRTLPVVHLNWWYSWNAMSCAEIVAGLVCAVVYFRRAKSQSF